MKLGAVCLFNGDKIAIPDYISIPIGLRKGTELTVGFLNNEELIFTPIPKRYWDNVYEFSIPLTHKIGASASAAEVLEEMGANILISESTAMGLISLGFWTGIVNLPKNKSHVNNQSTFKNLLIKKNRHRHFLADENNDVDSGKQICFRRLESLTVCNKMLTSVNISNNSFFDGYSIKIPEEFINRIARHQGNESLPNKQYAFLAADLQERILTLTFPRNTRQIYHIHLVINWNLKEDPVGIFSLVTQFLRDRNFSILRSYDYILKKTDTFEESIMRFIVDGPYLSESELTVIQNDLMGLKKPIGQSMNKKDIPFIVEKDVDYINNPYIKPNPLIFIPAEQRQPKCFIARLSSLANHQIVNEVRDTIKKLGFDTIEFTPSPKMQSIVFSSVLRSIKQCCCLVNIIVPHNNYKFIENNMEFPCPSPWLVAEDALALGFELKVFDIIDKSIDEKTLTVNRGMDSISGRDLFDSKDFLSVCNELEKKMKDWKIGHEFLLALGAASRRSTELK